MKMKVLLPSFLKKDSKRNDSFMGMFWLWLLYILLTFHSNFMLFFRSLSRDDILLMLRKNDHFLYVLLKSATKTRRQAVNFVFPLFGMVKSITFCVARMLPVSEKRRWWNITYKPKLNSVSSNLFLKRPIRRQVPSLTKTSVADHGQSMRAECENRRESTKKDKSFWFHCAHDLTMAMTMVTTDVVVRDGKLFGFIVK